VSETGRDVPSETEVAAGWRLVGSPEAGARAIRGGMIRGTGYVAGVALTAAASVLLLRYLGVVQFGRYVTVMSLIAVVSGITDAGLTAVANRELATRRLEKERWALMQNLVGLRLLLTPVGVTLATVFAVVAGYSDTLVMGTVLAGFGLVLITTQTTLILPLSADLRIAALTTAELLRQFVLVVGIVVLVLVEASLVAFFAIQIVVGAVALAATPFLLRGRVTWRPALQHAEWRWLLREALPIGAGLAMNVIYFRTLIIMMSLISTDRQTGLFGTSFRVFEILFGLAGIVIPVAMPILAVAAQADRERLRYVLQRVTEVAALTSAGFALVLAVAAEPLLVALGGDQYRDAAPVLRVQAVALIPVFLGQGWQLGLIAVRRQSALLIANAAAFVVVFVLGLALIPSHEAVGAAVAAVVAETVLAVALLLILSQAGAELRPRFGFVPRVTTALVPAIAVALVPFGPVLLRAIAAGIVFVATAWLAGAVPEELKAPVRGRFSS
jgi:O-antigen/teichoic acid export membrane protein